MNEIVSDHKTGGVSMEEDLRTFLGKCIERVPGLGAIYITDRDGVVVFKDFDSSFTLKSIPSSFMANFYVTAEQAGKLGFGKGLSMIGMYMNHQIVHFYVSPVVVSLVATSEANIGLMKNLEEDIRKAIQDLAHGCEDYIQTLALQ
eukprot:Nk52_evm3s1705 gene=Nk52_evmTU3s1705